MDKSTLLQLRGSSAKGYAFDRRYEKDAISDNIYDDCIAGLVEKVFKVRHEYITDACTVLRPHASCPCAGLQWHCYGLWTGVAHFGGGTISFIFLLNMYHSRISYVLQTGSGKTHTVRHWSDRHDIDGTGCR